MYVGMLSSVIGMECTCMPYENC